jgi:HTTM domain
MNIGYARETAQAAVVRFLDWLAQPHWLIGGSIFRICLGFIVFVFFALHIPERALYWGPDGLVSFSDYWQWFGGAHRLGPNLYAITPDRGVFELLFWAGLVIALLFTVGLWTRVVTPLFAVVVWSIYHRDPWVTNGGTRLLCIVVIYLIVADLGARFSVDAALGKPRDRHANAVSAMLHNTSMILVIVQLCMVYIFSTIYKLDGAAWQQGTGLYYALQDPQFNVSPLVGIVTGNPLLVTLGTYSTLLYQSAFPWLILHPKLKYAMVAIGIGFHLGIAVMMGLWWFSAVLVACEAVVLTDRQYEAVAHAFRALFAGGARPREMRAVPAEAVA